MYEINGISNPLSKQSRVMHVYFYVKSQLPDFQTQILLKIKIERPYFFSWNECLSAYLKLRLKQKRGGVRGGGWRGKKRRRGVLILVKARIKAWVLIRGDTVINYALSSSLSIGHQRLPFFTSSCPGLTFRVWSSCGSKRHST